MKILVVEDDQQIADMLDLFFTKEDWEVKNIQNGDEAIAEIKKDPNGYDLMTLDLNLPGTDGVQVAKQVREMSKIPIIMITARESESDQVIGFEMGADEYIVKPFSPITLISRVKSMMNRMKMNGQGGTTDDEADVQNDLLTLSTSLREVTFEGRKIEDLTPKEFELLKLLASYPRQVFTRESLVQTVWGYESFGDERTVDAHIKKLRQKLGELGPEVIQTVWGVGYKYDDTSVVKQEA
ncbi:MAG: response regulator transcription factor [Lactobacillaceae bacterium]|jgi:DNA-binding response OmpR family regulator|nr:response regulator transcription factor [Lactobacillaceae bacterium]